MRASFALLTQGWLGNGPGASLLAKQLRYIDAMKILLTTSPSMRRKRRASAHQRGRPTRSSARAEKLARTSALCRRSRCA
jgi:hypothetical protein